VIILHILKQGYIKASKALDKRSTVVLKITTNSKQSMVARSNFSELHCNDKTVDKKSALIL